MNPWIDSMASDKPLPSNHSAMVLAVFCWLRFFWLQVTETNSSRLSKNREFIARIVEYLTESQEELNQGSERVGTSAVPCISSAGGGGPSFQSSNFQEHSGSYGNISSSWQW